MAHDAGLFRIAEIHVVGDGERQGAGGGDVAPGLGHGLFGPLFRVGQDVAGGAIGGDGECAVGAFDADHGGIGLAGAFGGLAADLGVILVPDPAAGAEGGRGDQGFQRGEDAHRVSHRGEGGLCGGVFGGAVVERGFGFEGG